MKNNKTMRLALVLILLVAITLSVISGTLAKYVETVKGTDSARVAKFDYEAKVGETKLTTEGVTLNLFNTAFDDQVYGASANINNEKLVAPGTYGSFDIVATNKSEVDVNVTYTIAETNTANVPIVYFVKTGNTVNYYSSVESETVTVGTDVKNGLSIGDTVTIAGNLSAMANVISTTLEATDGTAGTPVQTTVGWFWAFGDGTTTVDSRDTELGKASTPGTVSVEIKATFEQVD